MVEWHGLRFSKIYKAELWFLCMAHRFIVLNNCIKFHLNGFNCCQLTERTRNSIANDQRGITPKIYKAELWFLCMSHCLIVLYKCMKFQPNSFNSVQLTERTRNCIYLFYKGNNFINIHARVMVLVHDRSSQCALQMYEVSLKYLQRLSSYRADTIWRQTDSQTDRQKDGQTDAREKQYVSRPLQGGDIMTARKCHNKKGCKEVPQLKELAGKATIKRTAMECYNQKDYH